MYLKISHIDKYITMSDEKEFVETYHAPAVQYLMKMTPSQLKEEFFKDMDCDKNGQKYNFITMSNIIREICRRAIKKNYKVKQTYKYASFMKEGRIYVKGSGIQQTSAEIRKFINGSKTYDIDIENAHFRILYLMVRKYNKTHTDNPLACKHLMNYVKNKKGVLDFTKADKHEFICMLYTDKIKTNKKDKIGYYPPCDWLREFHKEKQIIFQTLYDIEKDTYPYWNNNNDTNPMSSWFNKFICVEENNIIQIAIKHIHATFENRVEFPMYDGLCVSRVGVLATTIVESLNTLVKGILFVEKDNKSNYEMDAEIDEQCSMDYSVKKELFEETRCMIHNPYVFLQQIADREGKLEDVIYSETEFAKKHRNCRVLKDYPSEKDPDPYESIIKQWTQDEDMRAYNGLDFVPYSMLQADETKHQNDYYNMFREFKAKYIEKELRTEIRPEWFIDYIYDGLADGHQGKGDWLIKYIATIVQTPRHNQEVCLVLRGNQGTGKDTITAILGEIFGNCNNYIHRTSDVYEAFPEKAGFNSCLKNKLILQFNEVDGADTAKVKNKMKDAITRKENKINEKYIKEFIQTNYVQVIICSNSKSPVQIEWGDRRMAVMKTSNYHIGEEGKIWWSDFYKNNVCNKDKIDELFSWLIDVDISQFNAARDRVKTSEYNRLAESQISPNVLYLKHLAENSFEGWSSWTNKKTNIEYVFNKPRSYVDCGRHWVRQYLKIDYNIKASEFQRELQEFEGVEYNKSVKIKGKSARLIWIEKEKFISDISTKYKIQNDAEEFEIDFGECIIPANCFIESGEDTDTDDLDI